MFIIVTVNILQQSYVNVGLNHMLLRSGAAILAVIEINLKKF